MNTNGSCPSGLRPQDGSVSPLSSSSTTEGSSDSDDSDSSEDWSQDPVDPVLGVTIPTSATSPAVTTDFQLEHLAQAQLQFHKVTAPQSAATRVNACLQKISTLGPGATLTARQQFLRELRAQAVLLKPESERMLQSCPAHVRQVLHQAGPLGAHPALLRWCLVRINYSDIAVIDDLLRGFPLVGEITVHPEAPAKTVRRAK